ncbi:uncharacterized protein [Rutidosis leptorrhynchoides]|uniref:uncharacterized protein n=1 Tax=Rutidosis leptorrhynchoides TaxID=125765 RepID=UPI003A9A248D
MVTVGDTVTPMTVNPNDQQMNLNDSSDYEKCRQQRIKENLERMQKLGIYDLSLKMKSVKPNTNRRNFKPINPNLNKTPLPSPGPTRRSSRLQNTPTVSYTEVDVPKKGKERCDPLMMENSRPEFYTEEHEKLLGDAKSEWTLFVDGYGKNGKRIYDQVIGKTCHQCRQKTLGHRTHCRCNLVQGQFCGDCLYMRYGENVLEAMKNPNWICPVCRGICNCSLCRQAKGWAPTGVMYRKISSLGYKSVAHYLIQTRRADPVAENNEKNELPVCAKRSLPFSGDDDVARNENIGESKHTNSEAGIETEDGIETKEMVTDEKTTEFESSYEPVVNDVKLEGAQESKSKNLETEIDEVVKENKNQAGESEVQLGNTNLEYKVNNIDDEVKADVALGTKSGSRKKRIVPLENSIAGRLRSRRKCT